MMKHTRITLRIYMREGAVLEKIIEESTPLYSDMNKNRKISEQNAFEQKIQDDFLKYSSNYKNKKGYDLDG